LSWSGLTLLSPGRGDFDADFVVAGSAFPFAFPTGFAMAVPPKGRAAAYSIAAADVIDLAGKNQKGPACAAAFE
jgi:hypothetical protein